MDPYRTSRCGEIWAGANMTTANYYLPFHRKRISQNMKEKLNCWELNRCGREQDGPKVNEKGVCPAAAYAKSDGVNGGNNGGRICWAIVGTLGSGSQSRQSPRYLLSCIVCDFFQLVRKEEGDTYSLLRLR